MKFKDLSSDRIVEGEMRDLGRCYVSSFDIEGTTFYSVIPDDIAEGIDGAIRRLEEDKAHCAQFGYEPIYE